MRDAISAKPFDSGSRLGITNNERPQSIVAWRPILAACCGILCALAVSELAQFTHWSLSNQFGISLLAAFTLLFPTCLVESRTSCLVGLIPSLYFINALNTPWGLALIAAGTLIIAWWLRRREVTVVPDSLKQRQLSQKLKRYPRLHQSCLALAQTHNAQGVAETLVEQAMTLQMGGLAAGVYIGFNKEAPTLRARRGVFPEKLGKKADDALMTFVTEEKQANNQHLGSQLRMLFPLIPEDPVDQGHIGILEIIVVHDPHIDAYNTELAQALAQMGSIALGTADIVHQTRSLAIRDDLTGLLGQQEFRRRCREMLNHCDREGASASLLLCDLDHLKQFNDQHGHAAGDKALKTLATILQPLESTNDHSLVGRWGGEEFVIFLSHISSQKAEKISENLCTKIRSTETKPQQITASIGIAHRQANEDFIDLFKRSDIACYQAKRQGRDQVAISDGTLR
jgi:diguanylate cyclase (GGDEF)-like protein